MRYERVSDVLRLGIRLQANAEGLTLDEIAAEFSVSRRTAERMRDAVEAVFGPLEIAEPRGRRLRWKLGSTSLRSLLRISPVELAELESAAKRLDRAGLGEQAASLRSLFEKLRAVRRGVPTRDLDEDLEAIMRAEGLAMRPGPRPNLKPGLLSLLRDAIRERRVVEFEYLPQSKGGRRRHQAHPYGVLYGNRPYLVGRPVWAEDVRLWRLSNVSDARCLDIRFEPDLDFDLREYAERSFGAYQEPPFDVALRFDAEVAQDAATFQFHPSQSLVGNEDGSLSVNFRAGGLDEMCWHLSTWGRNVTVLQPDCLRQRLTEMGSLLTAHHGPGVQS